MTPNMVGSPIRVSATGTVCAQPCQLIGVLVNSTTSGTITLYDATSASGTPFVAAIAPAAGVYTPIPASLSTGLHFVEGNTIDVTFFVAVS